MIRQGAEIVDRALAFLESVFAVAALAVLILLSSYQMIVRNLHLPSPGWIDPLDHQLVLWAGFLGAVLAVRSRGHIRLDLVSHRLPVGWRVWVNGGVFIASAGVCALLARASWTFVKAEQERIAHIGSVPSWIFSLIIPAAFALMGVHFLLGVLVGPPAERSVEAERGLELSDGAGGGP